MKFCIKPSEVYRFVSVCGTTARLRIASVLRENGCRIVKFDFPKEGERYISPTGYEVLTSGRNHSRNFEINTPLFIVEDVPPQEDWWE